MITQSAPGWCRTSLRRLAALLALTATLVATSARAGLAVTWSMEFSPNTIGPGSTSTLTYTLRNNSPTGVRGAAFTNVLPAGITLSDAANPTIECDAFSVLRTAEPRSRSRKAKSPGMARVSSP